MKQTKYYHSEIDVQDFPFESITIDVDKYKECILQFNKSKNIEEKYFIATQLPNGIFPVCRFCGNIIVNSNFLLKIVENTVRLVKPSVFRRIINNNEYKLSCCEQCLKQHFINDLPKSEKYYFMKANKYGAYSFGYSYDDYKMICSQTTAVTLKSLQKKWGLNEGLKRWEEYCLKQSKSNSYEYKKEKYGWDRKTFDNFNKSRAVTKNNLINKYGDIEGNTRWESYCKKQQITKSFDYMLKKYGLEQTIKINKSKSQTLENYINRYGDDEGYKRFLSYLQKHKNYYSKISQKLFVELDEILGQKYKTYFATKGNGEYGIKINKKYYKLDYFIKDLNICIEFNGTHFHADPTIYSENDTPNFFNKQLTSKDIWEADNERIEQLSNIGIKTFIVWEREYLNNFDIIKFITQTLNIEL